MLHVVIVTDGQSVVKSKDGETFRVVFAESRAEAIEEVQRDLAQGQCVHLMEINGPHPKR